MSISTPTEVGSFLSLFRDRRSGTSKLNFAAATVAHAINYLTTEQLAGRRIQVQANREAVSLLCRAYEQLALVERREPERHSIMRRLSRFRNEESS